MDADTMFYSRSEDKKHFETASTMKLGVHDFFNLVDTLPTGLCLLDASLHFLYANTALAHMLGFSDTSYLLGKKFADFLESRYGDMLEQQLLFAEGNLEKNFHFTARTDICGQHGGDRWLDIQICEQTGESQEHRYN